MTFRVAILIYGPGTKASVLRAVVPASNAALITHLARFVLVGPNSYGS